MSETDNTKKIAIFRRLPAMIGTLTRSPINGYPVSVTLIGHTRTFLKAGNWGNHSVRQNQLTENQLFYISCRVSITV